MKDRSLTDRDGVVDAWMTEFARVPLGASPMPHSSEVLGKAELLRLGTAKQRILSLHAIAGTLPIVSGLLGGAFLLLQSWRELSPLHPVLFVSSLIACAFGLAGIAFFTAGGRLRLLIRLRPAFLLRHLGDIP
jgi:hypothetical protein